MAHELDAILPLFPDYNKVQFAIRQYCANCVAHRLTKFGWEPEINDLEPRLLLLLALCMPLHTRNPIIVYAWTKAAVARDRLVLDFLELHCPGYRMVPSAERTPDMQPVAGVL